MPVNFDITIIGNGVLGLTTAFELLMQDSTLKIAIIGPHGRQGGASQAAGAMLSCFGEVTHTTFHSDLSEKKFDLAKQALRLWPNFLERINEQLSPKNKINLKQGTFIILNSRSGKIESNNFNSIINALKEHNEHFEEIDPSDIPGLRPNQNERALRSLYLTQEGTIDSRQFLDNLSNLLMQNGVMFFTMNALNFQTQNASFLVQLENNQYLSSSKVILAAGVFTQKLLDQHPELSKKIPRLIPGVGISISLEQDLSSPIEQVIRTPNRAGACGLHVLPLSDNSLYLGASNDVFLEPQFTQIAGIVHFLLECAMEQINPNLYRSKTHWIRTGNRPISADGFPLIGETSQKGLYILSGTYRDGFHLSPILSNMIVEDILNGSAKQNENPFIPERALFRNFTHQEAIEIYLDHLLAANYEHGWKVPKLTNEMTYRTMVAETINHLTKKLNIDFGFAPEILLMHELTSKFEETMSFLKNTYG